MAADILFAVAEKLAQFLRVSNLSTADSDIEWMEKKLRQVHELLKKDPELEMNREESRKWVGDLIHAAQNIEDIVDNFDFNVERRWQRKGCMSSAFLAVKDKVARYKIVAEVKQAKEKMGQICESMPNKQVFGFDKDFDALVKLLVEGNDPHPLYMFIVGPCGAGKTTLLKDVYDSDAVKKQFPHRFWFSDQEYRDYTSFSMVSRKVESTSDALMGERYLIVLDINLGYPGGILSREDFISKFLSDVREASPVERNGSRVVVTSNEKMGAYLFGQEIEVYELGIMLDHPNYYQVDGPERTLLKIDSSFSLLEPPLKLILLYCSLFPKGFEIPKRRVIRPWLAVAEGWLQTEYDPLYHEQLQTSANSYFEELSHLGMIQVEYSYSRGGYLCANKDYVVKRIRLESPVWDFAAMKAMQCNLSHNIDNEGPPDSRSSSSNARGLALHSSGIYNHIFHDQKVSLPNLRWLLCFPQLTVIGGEVTFPTSRFKLLRVLDLEDMYFITQLSQEIGELVHLWYLGLRRTGLYSLPNSIGNLRNLESLDIRGTRVKPIPTAAIQKLKRLQYLYMDMDDGSTDDNDSLDVSSLESLRVLSVIRVGRWMRIGLGNLQNLTKLGIYGDPLESKKWDRDPLYYRFYRGPPRNLEILRLGFGFGNTIQEYILPLLVSTVRSVYLERPLQELPGPSAFPGFLKKLCLKWSLLEQDPMATLEHLEYLAVLKLRCGSFLGKKMVCSARWFPCLQFLELSLLDGLEEWTVEKGAMPKLQHLVIRLCNRLKELPQGLLHLHRIEKLEVAGMPDTFNARLQYNKGEDWHKIKHIKSVTVDGIQMAASSSSSSYSSCSFQPY